jgi:hypothetical protein
MNSASAFPRRHPPAPVPWMAAAILLAAAIAVLRVADPATSHLFPPCPFLWLTGWYCPGCGSLRAVHQLLLGNFRQAFAFNPLAVLSLPFVIYGAASHACFQLRGHYLPHLFMHAAWIRGLATAIVIFAILRNLPGHAFHWMAPGALLGR